MNQLPSAVRWIRIPDNSLPTWAALAVASLAAASWITLLPGRSDDLGLVRVWLDYWTSTWTSPYHADWLKVDYPPHALVLLWPLDWLPSDAAVWVLAANVVAALVFAWTVTGWLARETGAHTTVRHLLAFSCMLLSWGAIRAGLWQGQTVLWAAIAGVYALRLAERTPWLSGVALAIAATKPTLGAGFGLMLLFRGRYRSFLAGVGVSLALTLVFDITVGSVPFASIGDFAASLVHVYTGESYVASATTIRTPLVDLAEGHALAHVVFAIYGALALMALVWTVWPRRFHPAAQVLIANACLLWILLALPNQRYYLIMLAPLVWMLIWTPQAFAAPGAGWPAWLAAGLIIFNVIDAPLTLRRAAEYFGEASPFSLEWLWVGSYAMVGPMILACFVMVLRALRKISVGTLPAREGTARRSPGHPS